MTPTTNSVEPTTSASDEVRHLLDERGVEYHEYRSQISGSMESTTRFYLHDSEHHPYAIIEVGDVSANALLTLRCTPEQAIEATLGSVSEKDTEKDGDGCGECRVVEDEFGHLTCSECGATQPEDYTVYYCWYCGCMVKEY